MPLNPAIAHVLELIAKAKRPPFHTLTAAAARASYERSALIIDIAPAPMFEMQDIDIPTRDGASIRARLFHPVEPAWTSPAPTLVYFHGGGFVVGSINTHAALCRRLAADSGCAVVSVEYRLAPEHTFPPSTMPSTRSRGSMHKRHRSDSIPRVSPLAATARAARSPRSAPCLRAMRVLRCACNC